MSYRIETHNLDGCGDKRCHVYDLPASPTPDYWMAVTNVPCPCDNCDGTIRWAEAGYVPAYRICDSCGRHFIARGTNDDPKLIRVGNRRER